MAILGTHTHCHIFVLKIGEGRALTVVQYYFITMNEMNDRMHGPVQSVFYGYVFYILQLLLLYYCNGKEIHWNHLKSLYKRNSGAEREAVGLSLVPKLKYEHVHLTSFSKMCVDLAPQVSTVMHSCCNNNIFLTLLGSQAKALELTGGPECKETCRFVDMFDKTRHV